MTTDCDTIDEKLGVLVCRYTAGDTFSNAEVKDMAELCKMLAAKIKDGVKITTSLKGLMQLPSREAMAQ